MSWLYGSYEYMYSAMKLFKILKAMEKYILGVKWKYRIF